MALKWSILVATHSSRAEKFARLVSQIAPQLSDEIEVVVLWNRGAKTIGEYRQALVGEARGAYVSHVDDDDRLPDHYCQSILDALETRPDYVGFEVAVADLSERPINRRYRRYRAIHSLRYDRWFQRGNVFFRDVSHLNPIRRDLALKVSFEGLRAEDHSWAERVRPYVNSEVFVDDVLYFYDFDQGGSVRGPRTDDPNARRPILPEGFRYHPKSEV